MRDKSSQRTDEQEVNVGLVLKLFPEVLREKVPKGVLRGDDAVGLFNRVDISHVLNIACLGGVALPCIDRSQVRGRGLAAAAFPLVLDVKVVRSRVPLLLRLARVVDPDLTIVSRPGRAEPAFRCERGSRRGGRARSRR